MKTQIVYAVVSGENDLFLEELWISAYSLRIYNPDAIVNVITDTVTAERIEKKRDLSSLFTNIVSVELDENLSSFVRSRLIKTSIRNRIDGDFLYIDTDTVICHKLDEIDEIQNDISNVPDAHLKFNESPYAHSTSQWLRQIFSIDISNIEFYFNGGVSLVKDNERTREFYKRWNETWISAYKNNKLRADQPSLCKVNIDMGNLIKPLPDKFNCQLGLSMKYLHEAYIVHSIHMNFIEDQSFSPFLGGTIYRDLKNAGEITPEIAHTILNCKSSWHTRCQVVGPDQIDFLWSPAGQAFSRVMKNSRSWTKFLNWCGMKVIMYDREKKKMKKFFNK